MFLLILVAHSNWSYIFEMAVTRSDSTIAMLQKGFAAFELPEQLVSDNGSQFTSNKFTEFLCSNGVKHILTALYHPSSNGGVK